MKSSIKFLLATLSTVFMAVGLIGQASAGSISLTTTCSVTTTLTLAQSNALVKANGASANACLGLYDKDGGGAGPNDSIGLLNNAFLDGSGGWGSGGAFGINTWSFLGKDERNPDDGAPPNDYNFINVTSADPATWVVDSALLAQPYLFAAKQSNLLGLWKFDSLSGVLSGTADMNGIFGAGTADGGWSHFSIYTSAPICEPNDPNCNNQFPVPEPGVLGLLGMGLLGLGLSRRRLKLKA